MFSDITSGKRFPNLLYCSDSAQIYRIDAYLIVKFAQIIKWTTLIGEKIRFWAKCCRKKRVFRGFRHYFRKLLRKLALLLRLSSKLQDIRLFDCKRCANNKKDHFSFKKIRFWAKKRRKNGFFVVFRHYFRKTLPKLAVLLRFSSNLQDRRLFDCKISANNKMHNFNWRKN